VTDAKDDDWVAMDDGAICDSKFNQYNILTIRYDRNLSESWNF